MIERAEVGSSGKAKLDTELSDELRDAAGATGARGATAGKAAAQIGQLIALRVSGAGAPPPPTPTAPSAPRNLAASAGSSVVNLTWSAPSTDGGSEITAYRIYRGTATGAETFLIAVGNVTTYADLGLTNGTPYFYKVSAVNSIGESVQSNEATATPQSATVPGAPRNVTAVAGKPRGVSLTWQAPASNGGSVITGYEVWRSTATGGETRLATLGNVLSYKDTAATKATTYYYVVKAVNAIGVGPASAEVSATAR
jgi:predicted phage tail protein